MTQTEFKARTKALAVDILKLCDQMPRQLSGQVVARQLARCGTSVAANYRAACRARSKIECAAKLGIVEEEADETLLWLEISTEVGLIDSIAIKHLEKEMNEILSMTVASIKTIRRNLNPQSAIRNPQSAASDPNE